MALLPLRLLFPVRPSGKWKLSVSVWILTLNGVVDTDVDDDVDDDVDAEEKEQEEIQNPFCAPRVV